MSLLGKNLLNTNLVNTSLINSCLEKNAVYVPLTIGDPRFIFDARYVNGLNTTNPAIGSSIAQWKDLSIYGNHLAQATGSAQPVLRENIMNGQPALESTNAANTLMTVAGNSSLNPSNATVFVVFRLTSVAPAVWGLIGKGTTNHVYGCYGATTFSAASYITSGGTFQTAAIDSAAINTNYIMHEVWDGTTMTQNRNGITQTEALSPLPLSNTGSKNLIAFQQKQIAGRSLSGYISFMAMYDGQMPAADIATLRSYLAETFGGVAWRINLLYQQ